MSFKDTGALTSPELEVENQRRTELAREQNVAPVLVTNEGLVNTEFASVATSSPVSDTLSVDNLEEIVFQEQCVLLENFEPLVQNNFDKIYDNFAMIHGSTGKLTNALQARRNIMPFWNITPEQLAHLQPTVRLFKVRYDDDGNEVDAVEMPFAQKTEERDLEDILNTKGSRGSGVNMRSFDWRLQGSNPAEATNIIECSLTLRFESLQDLIREHSSIGKDGKYTTVKFSELLTPPSKLLKDNNCTFERGIFNPDYFTFRIITGWADLNGAYGSRKDLKELNNVLKQDQKTFTLTLTNHNINFTQEGPVDITIEANARLDVVTYLQDSDIYQPYRREFRERLSEYNREKNQFQSLEKCITDKSPQTEQEKLQKEKEDLQLLLDSVILEKVKMWSVILGEMIKKDRIFSITIPQEKILGNYDRSYYEQLGKIKDYNPEIINRQLQAEIRAQSSDRNQVLIDNFEGSVVQEYTFEAGTELEKFREEIEKNKKQSRLARFNTEKGTYTIPFVYLGDIFDIALQSINPKKNKLITNEQVILGDISLYDPRVDKVFSVNLADVPVSVSLFQEWFMDQVYGSSKGEIYPVKLFIKDVIEKLLPPLLSPDGCFVEVPQRTIKISTTHFSAAKKDGKDPLFDGCNRNIVESLKELKKPKRPYGKDIAEYYIIYASESFPAGQLANAKNDLEEGIYHFLLGRDRGLIKSINFSRADMPFMRESRIVAEGDSEFGRLREYYEADIDMIGNNLFIPGDAIFINPSTIVLGNQNKPNSIGQILGLIGYYRVITVSSFIEAGVYDTKIKANWEASGDGMSYSISDQNAAIKNCLCTDGQKLPPMQNSINIRNIYSSSDIVVLRPTETLGNYCRRSLGVTGPQTRKEKIARAKSGGFVPR